MPTRRSTRLSVQNSNSDQSQGIVERQKPVRDMASRSKRQQALADTFNLPPTTKKKDRTQQVLTDTTNNTSQSFDSNEKEHAGFNGFNSNSVTPEEKSPIGNNQENLIDKTENNQPASNNHNQLADSEPDQASTSKSSEGGTELDNIIADVVGKHIKEEEEKLEKLSSKQETTEANNFLQEWEKVEEEQKEERYRKLQLLLNKSEMYTKYLLGRMEAQKRRMTVGMNTSQSSQDSSPPRKKKKDDDDANLEASQLSQQSQSSESEAALCNGCPLLFTGELRPYQVEGLLWLNTMFENGVNGILADEMGLGKTVQCIAAIAHLVSMNVRGPYLIVVPLSTLPNWVNEFKRFAPKVPVMLYHGPKAEREWLRRDIRKSKEVDGQWYTQPVVCTSYEVAMADRQYLMSMRWKYLIVDEGHRIKNAQCRLIKELRMYDSTHRVLLTGTPLQNNLSELWSLLNFLLPEVFDDLDSFEYWFKLDCLRSDQQDQLIAEEKKRNILSMLHKIMTPFILRRLKSDVELNLPPKQELLVYAPLTQQQRKLYEATVDCTIMKLVDKEDNSKQVDPDNLIIPTADNKRSRRSSTLSSKVNYQSQLAGTDSDDEDINDWVKEIMDSTAKRHSSSSKAKGFGSHVNNIKMRNPLMMLRKCCSHPYLLSQPIDQETGYCKIDEEVVKSSGKMLILDAMLKELKKTGHKVLIFSQMTKMLDLIEDYCHLRELNYCRLDGQTDMTTRGEQMQAFNTDPDQFLFLLSTRAGGLGINLSSADTVIIYDSDWNPQCDLQAQDRAHRIGQTKPVMIYRLVCANTVDEKIVERASRKRRLEKMVIHKEKFKTGMTREYTDTCKPISSQELLELLKSHDHEAAVDVTNKRREVISKKELAALLDRSHLVEQWKVNQEKARSGTAGKSEAKSRGRARQKMACSTGANRVFKVIGEEGAEL